MGGNKDGGGDVDEKQDLLTNVKSIAHTRYAFAALKEDGSVIVWGRDKYGGDAGEKQDLLTIAKTIVGNLFEFAALKEDGSVVVWGDYDYGGYAGEKQSDLTDIEYIGAADRAFAVRKRNGDEIVWGKKSEWSLAVINLHKIVEEKSKEKHIQRVYENEQGGIATLYTDGSVMCSGIPDFGGNAGEKQDLLI